MHRLLLIGAVSVSITACQCTPATSGSPAGVQMPEQVQPAPGEVRPVKDTTEAIEPVKLTPLKQGTGYALAGAYNLEGVLEHDGRQWQLNAQFMFPTGGYTVAELEVTVLKKLPEEVHILIPVQPPPINALVTQATETVAIQWSGTVRKDATFETVVRRVPPGVLADSEQ